MSTQRYSFTPHPIETILTGQDGRDRHPGDPAAFVWNSTKVRNFLDLFCQGHPTAWRDPTVELTVVLAETGATASW